MVEITFRQSAIERIVESRGLDIDKEGRVIDDEEVLTDGYGTSITIDSVGGVFLLDSHGFSVNKKGIVVDTDGDPVAFVPEDASDDAGDSIVPFVTDDGERAGLLRDSPTCVREFVEASDRDDPRPHISL